MKPVEILVDADACPVKEEIYRVARRYGLPVKVVANAWINVPQEAAFEFIQVSDGFDAADDWIAEHAHERAVVITSDIPLAKRCLDAKATVIGPTGRPFTEASIGNAMASRALMEHLRAMGEVTGGPKPMDKRARSTFLSTLDEAVVKLRRQRPPIPPAGR
ncbi:YaiI/YqxD family protein [Aquibaculum arenosum]|uniref:UPF0178 protein P2G67_11780 n=1 Tax=Aquibaculum arenosum TaxID=3032591 RepID=A0ABT5YNW8_9PROT|nr:YaiI/YqxD family protein [Fodinicurvata sp. CAU 1616]MDF2096658.1 YaiI/YqxD family protein [Fodinicurvata sp. CAU 1616]